MRSGRKWKFNAGRFTVSLYLNRAHSYRYDGDDEDGETQAALDSGELIAFDSEVRVELDGETIGADFLGGSVYYDGRESEFWTDHRDPNPEHRNTLANKAKRVCIGHYFPDMVRQAIAQAREHIRSERAAAESLPRVRETSHAE